MVNAEGDLPDYIFALRLYVCPSVSHKKKLHQGIKKNNNNNLPTYLPIPWKPESGRGNKDIFNGGLIFQYRMAFIIRTSLFWKKKYCLQNRSTT